MSAAETSQRQSIDASREAVEALTDEELLGAFRRCSRKDAFTMTEADAVEYTQAGFEILMRMKR